jgi:hypothetical protein
MSQLRVTRCTGLGSGRAGFKSCASPATRSSSSIFLDLLVRLAAADGVVDAMRDMVLQHLVLHLLEGGAHGLQLVRMSMQ